MAVLHWRKSVDWSVLRRLAEGDRIGGACPRLKLCPHCRAPGG
jgi:hypothetical protein